MQALADDVESLCLVQECRELEVGFTKTRDKTGQDGTSTVWLLKQSAIVKAVKID